MDPAKRDDFRELVESVEDHPLEIAKDILLMHSRLPLKGAVVAGHSVAQKP